MKIVGLRGLDSDLGYWFEKAGKDSLSRGGRFCECVG